MNDHPRDAASGPGVSGPVIGPTIAEAVPSWRAPPRPPHGSPDVVVVVLDDVGFAQLGCYGSDIETPSIDRLAAPGARLADFHTTSFCAHDPARALAPE